MAKVIVYSQPTCGYCKMLKEFLAENKIKYEDKDVTADPKAMEEFQEMGHTGTPVTIIDGKTIVGFKVEELKKALKIE
jgi:glutaredoxin-like YruB-family protein